MKRIWAVIKEILNGSDRDFTKGSINKALFFLAIPMILEMAMESLFAIVDIYFISKLDNPNATSAIGLTETFMFIVMSVALGIAMAATAVVSRRIGEKKNREAGQAGAQAIILAVLLSLIIGGIGLYFSADLLRLMGSSEEMIEEGVIYTQIILSFNIVLMLLYVNNAIFRGACDANIAMKTLWLANGINIILDPCLILGLWIFPEWGLMGAAIATCIGRGIGVLYQFYHLFKGSKRIKIYWSDFKIRVNTILKLFKLSIGGAGQHLLTSASWIFIARIINEFGAEAFAGYTYSFRVIVFTILPSWGVAMAAATLVGQNLGANQPERAEKSVWLAAFYNMLFLAVISIIFLIYAEPVIRVFSDDPLVVSNGKMGLQIVCLGYIFYAYEMVIGQSFNGAGDTVTPTILNFICFWLIQIPLAYYLAKVVGLGPKGVYITIAISSSILAVLAVLVFRRGKWKTTVV